MWFFVNPLDYEVWLGLMISVPVYLLVMALADYLFSGNVNLDFQAGFILRNVLSEQNGIRNTPTKIYQKLLIIAWILSMLVLVNSYAGNLTAMLVKPKLDEPISTLEGLLDQKEIPWVVEDGVLASFLKSFPSGSLLKQLHDGAIIMPQRTSLEKRLYGCFTTEIKQKGVYSAVCSSGDVNGLMFNDYSKTGKCNYYVLEDKLLTSGAFIAFQVKQNKF